MTFRDRTKDETRPATVAMLLREGASALAAAGVETARLDARLLLTQALGVGMEVVVGHPQRPVSAAEATAFDRMVRRRAGREPIAHILGGREFWSLPFCVTSATLVPRPDSETVVETALKRIGDRRRPLRILDLGTGSGCLLLALLSELPSAWGLGIDRSAAAIAVARENASALGLVDRSAWLVGDWAAAVAAPFDLVVANPPYVCAGELDELAPEVRAFEPRTALDGGPDGLEPTRSLLRHLGPAAAAAAVVVLECGAGQAPTVAGMMAACGIKDVEIKDDLCGIGRCVSGMVGNAPTVEKKAWKPSFSRLGSELASRNAAPDEGAPCFAN